MKKILIYLGMVFLSIIFTICTNDNITNNAELVLQILLTLLGLCITSYVFICSPISEVASKNKQLKRDAINLVSKLEEDMKGMFYITLVIIFVTIMGNTDLVFIKNPCEMDFGIFVIKSFKHFLINASITFCFMLGMAGFYDFIVASFKITKGLLFIDK